jgi:hypothetical protein
MQQHAPPTAEPTPTGGGRVPEMATISEGLQAFGAITLVDPTTALKDSVTTNAEQIKLAVGGFGEDFVALDKKPQCLWATRYLMPF